LHTRQDGCPLKTPSSVYCADTSNIRRRHSDILLSDHIHNLIASQPCTGWTYASCTEPHLNEIRVYRPEKMQNGVLETVFSHRPWVDRHISQSFINRVVAGGKTAGKCPGSWSQNLPKSNHYIPTFVFTLYVINSYLFPAHFSLQSHTCYRWVRLVFTRPFLKIYSIYYW
jgi:hypothetical protein